MADFRLSIAEQSNELTSSLVKILRAGVQDTDRRDEWTQKLSNINDLYVFVRRFAKSTLLSKIPRARVSVEALNAHST
jgi:hypothetical protein